MNEYLSTGEAARLLRVPAYRIVYALTTGRIQEPIRLFGKRAFRRSDLTAMAAHFGVQLSDTETSDVEEREHNAHIHT